ncbi:hypothetical protein CPB85DRAFT_1460449 [Mucidula mucida]|nr:hypothetical protein CPB85DRAFT_1460449 [Mucidula mucida]
MSEILPPRLDKPFLSSLQLSAPESHYAFSCVSEAETSAIHIFNQSGDKDMVAKGNIVASRVLGCLLHVLDERPTGLTDTVVTTIRHELFNDTKWATPDRNTLIYEVGAAYRDHLLRAFRESTAAVRPPTPEHPSRASFDKLDKKWREDLIASSVNYDTSRSKTLARDGYRCKLTMAWKDSSCIEVQELSQMAIESRTGRGPVQVCHIVNESLTQRAKGTGKPKFLRILEMFGMKDVAETLASANGVHSLTNLLCLGQALHTLFDKLDIWFEPTNTKHEYTVHTAYDIAEVYAHWQDTVVFSVFPHRYETFRNADLPLPDPKLLVLHGICARVAQMSGAIRYFDEIDRDMKALKVLASDGSTSTTFLQSILAPYED